MIANDYPYTAGVIFSFLGLIQQVSVHFKSSSLFKDNENSITDLQYSFSFNGTAVFSLFSMRVSKIYSSVIFQGRLQNIFRLLLAIS